MSSPSSLLLGPPGSRHLPQIPSYPDYPSAASPTLAFVSTGNPCLDFFFYVVPDTDSNNVVSLLASAWAHDPLLALKLVCNLRGIRGAGKSDRGSFYASALWLHSHHPKTLALNLPAIARFGYFKDALEILHRLIDPADMDTIGRKRKVPSNEYLRSKRNAHLKHKVPSDVHRRSERNALASRSVARYNGNANYQFLHNRVADLFAERLASDVEHLRAGRIGKIGLAAKWCPSLCSSFDRSTLLCESIARKMFPKDSDPDYATIEDEAHYAYRVRTRLRKEVLVPLRKALELPEANMSADSWASMLYDVVPSVAMKKYAEHFSEKDKDRFFEHLANVKEGKVKIAAGALFPQEILNSHSNVAELQWRRMVQDLSDKGRLKNSIAACCGSAEAVTAFALLISELTDDPWKGRVMAFCGNPYFGRIEGESLQERMFSIRRLSFGTDAIDIRKLFDHLLQVAMEQKLEKENMIETVFVLVDQEFDWETDYETVCRNFRESGYSDCVPQIVLWNVSGSISSVPVALLHKGVVLASGWSKNLLKFFLEGGKALSPAAVMEYAISGEEYRSLEVFD